MLVKSTNSHLPPLLANLFDSTSLQTGIASDQIRLLFCLIFSILLGFIYNLLHNNNDKHRFNILWGTVFVYTVVGYDCIHLYILSTIVYILINSKLFTTLSPPVCIISMLYLCIIHIYRLYTDYLGYKLECSMLLMIAVPKLHQLACNIDDYNTIQRLKNSNNNDDKITLHSKQNINDYRIQHSISLQYDITFLSYYSYILYYPTVLVGPVIEYKSYIDYINDNIISLNKRVSGILQSLSNALLCGIMFLLQMTYIHASGYIDSNEFLYNTTFLYRLIYINVLGPFCRSKYYLVWYLSSAGCIASNYGYNKKHNNWSHACNARAVVVETADSFQTVSSNWNIGVSEWLKNYVYLRITAPRSITKFISSRTLQNYITKATSAFYHGFYPSYYMFFLSMSIVTTASTAFNKTFSHYFIHNNKNSDHNDYNDKSKAHYVIWRILCWTLIYSPLNILGMAFILLDTKASLNLYNSMYYYGHLMPIIVLLFSKVWGILLRRRVKEVTVNGKIE